MDTFKAKNCTEEIFLNSKCIEELTEKPQLMLPKNQKLNNVSMRVPYRKLQKNSATKEINNHSELVKKNKHKRLTFKKNEKSFKCRTEMHKSFAESENNVNNEMIVYQNSNSISNNESGFMETSINRSHAISNIITHLNSATSSNCTFTSSEIFKTYTTVAKGISQESLTRIDDRNASSPESGIDERDEIKFICPICDTVSISPHEFTNHIRCHNYSSGNMEHFVCQICSKILSSASSLDRHVLVHTGERPFNCKYCHLTFTTNGNMHRHMRTHKEHGTNQYLSNLNGISSKDLSEYSKADGVWNSKTSVTKLIVTEDDKLPSVGNCDIFVGPQNLSNEREEISGSYSHNCDSDGETASLSILSHNLKTGQKYDKSVFDNNFSEGMCDFSNNTVKNDFRNKALIEEIDKQDTITCPVCGKSEFDSRKSLSIHLDNSHQDVAAKCSNCDVIFKTHRQLNIHPCISQNDVHFFERSPFFDFSCSHCTRKFESENSLKIHLSACTKSLEMKILKTIREDLKSRDALLSGNLNDKNCIKNAKVHNKTGKISKSDILNETEKLPINENSTDSETENKTSLTSLPTTEISTAVAECDNNRLILNAYSSAASSRHLEEAYNSNGLDIDMENEETQDIFAFEFRKMKLCGEFPCKLCSAIFPNLRALKGHNRIHLSAVGPKGPFRCNMCPYFVFDKLALIRHMRGHNGDRPYECAICGYAFTTKANCERHLRNRHSKTTRDEVKKSLIYHPSEDTSPFEDLNKKPYPTDVSVNDNKNGEQGKEQQHRSDSHIKKYLKYDRHNTPKIQIRKIDFLMNDFSEIDNTENQTSEVLHASNPIDLSMDILDLRKKPVRASIESEDKILKGQSPQNVDTLKHNENEGNNFSTQELLKSYLQKATESSHYVQQFCRNLATTSLNTLHPFANQYQLFLPTNTNLRNSTQILLKPQITSFADEDAKLVQQKSKLPEILNLSSLPPQPPASVASNSNIKIGSFNSRNFTSSVNLPILKSSESIKMVIKNGVLMPKQKQRRYRTERPFSCDYCKARFTLRSNMERHIKQQHPQFCGQKMRNAQNTSEHIVNTNANDNTNTINTSKILKAQLSEVKQRSLNSCEENSSSLLETLSSSWIQEVNVDNKDKSSLTLISHALATGETLQKLKPGNKDCLNEPFQKKRTSSGVCRDVKINNDAILECLESSAKRSTIDERKKNIPDPQSHDTCFKNNELHNNNCLDLSTMFAGHKVKDKAVSNFSGRRKDSVKSFYKEECQDLVPVSKLVDNARTNAIFLNSYFRRCDTLAQPEQSDEEGLVASGSASESNNSGAEDVLQSAEPKKKSAYSLAPNRVSCPYCQRMFPWSSSLRRHILTHTGQKPFKCSQCPLLFTTKSNCDRHLLRKHGNVEHAVSVYVPAEDVNEPIPTPRSKEIMQNEHEKSNRSVVENDSNEDKKDKHKSSKNQSDGTEILISEQKLNLFSNHNNQKANSISVLQPPDLPFKCHLCENTFRERSYCLDHIKNRHEQDFNLLLNKGAMEADLPSSYKDDDNFIEEFSIRTGKYPDYSSRKVVCAFCLRRFWSTEDLRRHMRTHSGERPFRCNICLRKFTLKHSMLRHMKKHIGSRIFGENTSSSTIIDANSGSDVSEEEQPYTHPYTGNLERHSTLTPQRSSVNGMTVHDQSSNPDMIELKENISEERCQQNDLIGNLLGISDQGVLNKLLSSAEEAAKLLGIEKKN